MESIVDRIDDREVKVEVINFAECALVDLIVFYAEQHHIDYS